MYQFIQEDQALSKLQVLKKNMSLDKVFEKKGKPCFVTDTWLEKYLGAASIFLTASHHILIKVFLEVPGSKPIISSSKD